MNKINTLAEYARLNGIETSNSLRDDIVEEYTDIIDSLETVEESVINRDISLLPVYKINEEYDNSIINEGLIKRVREIIKQNNWKKEARKLNFDALKQDVTPYKRKVVHSKSDMDRFYNNNDFCIEGVTGDEEFCQIAANILASHFKIKTPVETYVTYGKDFNKIYDLHGSNAYRNDTGIVIIPLDTVKSKDIVMAKAAIKARYFNDVVDNNEYREYAAGRHEYSPQIQWLLDAYGESTIEESEIINESYQQDYEAIMSFNMNLLKRMPLIIIKGNEKTYINYLEKYETQLKDYNKMNDSEKSDFCKKLTKQNKRSAMAMTALSGATGVGVYTVYSAGTITPDNYEKLTKEMISKLKKITTDLNRVIDQKEKAKGIKEGYAIDLDSLKYVVESKEITLQEAIQEIRDVNYIGDTYPMYCVLPENINENMSLESFIALNESLNNSEIIPVSIREFNETEFVTEGVVEDSILKNAEKTVKGDNKLKIKSVKKNAERQLKLSSTGLENFKKSSKEQKEKIVKSYIKTLKHAGAVTVNTPNISDYEKSIKDTIKLQEKIIKMCDNRLKELESKK